MIQQNQLMSSLHLFFNWANHAQLNITGSHQSKQPQINLSKTSWKTRKGKQTKRPIQDKV